MSRRARAVQLWAALKYLGREGVDELVFGLHQRAVQMGEELKRKSFNILNEVVFNQVIVACDNDEHTDRTMQYIQKSVECWVGGANWYGKSVIRVSVCSRTTKENDIARSVQAFAAARIKAGTDLINT
jgi:glutamate/tyrosine decarboxylase-like PLP-dependent enzyme